MPATIRFSTAGLTFAALLSTAAPAALAQYASDFEAPAFSAAADGVSLVDQNGFYLPTEGGLAGRAFTYAGNVLGVAANPTGGEQFIACMRGTDAFGRIQRNVVMPIGCAGLELDVNLSFVGPPPATNYGGSISLQPYPGDGSIILVLNWEDQDTADAWSVGVLGFAADGGVPFPSGIAVPDPAFRNLTPNAWYRLTAEFDVVGNHLAAVSIRPIGSADEAIEFRPTSLDGYYLGGGAVIGRPAGAVRFFGGGGFPHDVIGGNTLAIDNVFVGPPTRDCTGDLDLDGDCELNDLATLLTHFGMIGNVRYADGDINCDARVDLTDLSTLLTNFGAICN